jgi:hypothetical protein
MDKKQTGITETTMGEPTKEELTGTKPEKRD